MSQYPDTEPTDPEAALGRGWRITTGLDGLHWGLGISFGKLLRVWYVVAQLGPWQVRLTRGNVAAT